MTTEKASLEATAKESKDQLRQVETSKQATEQTLKEVISLSADEVIE